MKAKRQSILLEFLEQGLVDSQAEAVKLLRQRGIVATQATVSRDLEELGAARVRTCKGMHYAVEIKSSPYGAPIGKTIKDYVISAIPSGNIIVLHTPPGHAAMVAAAIDRTGFEEALGTIAGDDTVFICCKEGKFSRSLITRFEDLKNQN